MKTESIATPIPGQKFRSFGVADAMILLAALAVALWRGSRFLRETVDFFALFCQTIVAYNDAFFIRRPGLWVTQLQRYGSSTLWYGFRLFDVLLSSLAPAFVLIRLRRPRPRLGDLVVQPGFAASLAMVFGLFWVTGWLHRLFFGRMIDATVAPIAVGGTVAVAWSALFLSRKWNAEPSWIDRAGRLQGAAAITIGLLCLTEFGV